MATLLSLGGYVLYILYMIVSSHLLAILLLPFPSFLKLPDTIKSWIVFSIPFALKNFQWVVLISESHYTLPSSVSEVIAILLCLAIKQVWLIIGMVLVDMFQLVLRAILGQTGNKDQPDEIGFIFMFVTILAVDTFMSYSSMVLNDVDPAFISEFLSSILRFFTHIMATLLPLAGYLGMVALSCLVFAIAYAAIENTRVWWPELIHTSIVGLTLLLLNMMWGSPFQKPSTDSDMKAALIGLVVYLIYIVFSMALSYGFFGPLLLLKTFIISLTFVLLDMFLKPSSVSDIIAALVGLTGMITTSLLAILILLASSFVVFMFLHTWAEILIPSARRNYPAGTFAIIVSLTFMGMKIMLDIPVDKTSIFSDMKAGLIGITYLINDYHDAFVVIRNLTVLVVPIVLSMESRRKVSMYKLYTTAAFVVALGLVLTMPPGPGMPTENPASTLVTEDFVQEKITSFVTSQIKRMDGEILQLTDS